MDNYVLMAISLILGILFISYSRHTGSYEKTVAVEGEHIARKKFRIIKLCGYVLIFVAGLFGLLAYIG
jgi:accessory gene regulator protein AgrB